MDASPVADGHGQRQGGLSSSPSSRRQWPEKKTVHAVAKSLYGKPFHFAIVDPTTQRSSPRRLA